MLKSRISSAPRRTGAIVTSALLTASALVGATAYSAATINVKTAPVVEETQVDNQVPQSSSSTDMFDFLFALNKIFSAPAAVKDSVKEEAPVEKPAREFPYAVQGDVVDIAGEAVYVCATGNGYGLSHVGATLMKSAGAEATRAESARLCATALRVASAVVVANGSRSELLTTPRIIESGGRYECNPAEPGVLRCGAEDGSLFTLWDVAY